MSPGDVKSPVEINDLTPNGPEILGGDLFGSSVANLGDIDGDGIPDIAVGAEDNDTGGINKGSLYIIFLNPDGTPKSTVQINDLIPNGPNLSDNDSFGSSVANLGDLDGNGIIDIAVGATGAYYDIFQGSLHIIFLNPDGTPKSTVEINDLTPNGPDLSNGDHFGWSVASIGDIDGDGINDIAVGAVYDDAGGANKGSLHIIFLNSDGTPKSTVEINDLTENGPVISNDDWFGSSVANLGDLNGDGITDIAVGADGDDEWFNKDSYGSHPQDNKGSLHIIFLNSDGTPKSTVEINDQTVNGPDLSGDDFFGSSVASLGDLDGDGVTDIAVGAKYDNDGGRAKGSLHIIFLNPDGTPKSSQDKQQK